MNTLKTVSGPYYADLDENTTLFCVFDEAGKAVASFFSREEAKSRAASMNLALDLAKNKG